MGCSSSSFSSSFPSSSSLSSSSSSSYFSASSSSSFFFLKKTTKCGAVLLQRPSSRAAQPVAPRILQAANFQAAAQRLSQVQNGSRVYYDSSSWSFQLFTIDVCSLACLPPPPPSLSLSSSSSFFFRCSCRCLEWMAG